MSVAQDGGDGLHFLYIRRNALYFVAATKFNVPPAFGLELLSRYVQYPIFLPLSPNLLHRPTAYYGLQLMLTFTPFWYPSLSLSPSSVRIAGVCKDYCGLLNEEAIRLNFSLIYELLDEVLVSFLHLKYSQFYPTWCQ